MRDIIWTVIIVWLVFKLIEIFRGVSSKKSFAYEKKNFTGPASSSSTDTNTPGNRNVKSALQKRADKEGEYVDFEEIK